MTGILCTIPLALALAAVVLGIMRSIATAWFNHRLRIELLRKLEKNPDLVDSPAEMQDLLQKMSSTPGASEPQDYTFTGVVLAVIGGACIVLGRIWRVGQLASGVYWGGMACVFLGVGLAILGLLLRVISRRVATAGERGNVA